MFNYPKKVIRNILNFFGAELVEKPINKAYDDGEKYLNDIINSVLSEHIKSKDSENNPEKKYIDEFVHSTLGDVHERLKMPKTPEESLKYQFGEILYYMNNRLNDINTEQFVAAKMSGDTEAAETARLNAVSILAEYYEWFDNTKPLSGILALSKIDNINELK